MSWILHVIPTEDLIDHMTAEDCACGPRVEFLGEGQIFVHHSLDGREKDE